MDELRFEIEDCVGTGGFGVVYRARMTTPEGLVRTVAVKSLRADVAGPHAVARLRDEARLLAALRHRAILTVHDLVRLDGNIALVCEFVEGADLAALIAETRTGRTPRAVPSRVAAEVVGEVAGALAAAWHAQDPTSGEPLHLVHRDIKPANIRVSTHGAVKLLDFGIARSETVPRDSATADGLVPGTLGYLAPDRFTEEGVEPAADVYALGLVLFELLTGDRLLGERTRRELLEMALQPTDHDTFVAAGLERLKAEDDDLVSLVHDMLRYDPRDRPTAATVETRAEDLADRLAGPRLRQWARDREWHRGPRTSDPLVGCTVAATGLFETADETWADSGVDAPSDPAPARQTSGRPSRGVAGLGLGLLLAGLGAGALWWGLGDGPHPADLPPSGPTQEPPVAHTSPSDPPTGESPAAVSPPAGPAAPGSSTLGPSTQGVPSDPIPSGETGTATPPPSDPVARPGGPSGTSAQVRRSRPHTAPPSSETARAAAPVRVAFSSYPLGATVEVPGSGQCTTPCEQSVPPGQHTATFSLPDGRSARELIDVSAERSTFGHRFVRPAEAP